MEEHSVSLIVILFCIVMSAYFSATETAFSSLNRIRIKNMAEKGNKKAALVLRLSENFDGMLSTILIGNNIVNILLASLATILCVDMIGEDLGATVSTVVTTIVVLIFGEVSPKSIAKESPESFAMFSAPLLNVLMVILTPANFLFRQWKKLLSKMIKVSDDTGITEEELLTIVEEAEQEGGIDKEESDLIRSAIEFGELEAVDIFTPRIDIVGISVDASKDDIAKVFMETGYSRLPVYEQDIDQIVGILYQKDFHNYIYNSEQSVRDNVKPVLFTTKNKKIDALMKELQREKLHIAVIVDEYGSTLGIVTLEDILEELVGEIWDEHDTVIHEIEEISAYEYIVSGKANLEKMLERLNKKQDTEVLTVNGWVMEKLEKIPAEGDSFEFDGLSVEVVKMNGKRVEQVRVLISGDDA
ncbi:MAG: HlyC/CorC family transporter [Lachnospiraceae bacterium]|nr:HlyC/CorC family transporter [Lachnospiraceae bacterium]